MLKFGNKEFNNLQEQVLENANEILEIKQSLGTALPNPIEGPEGPQGPQGIAGPQGVRGSKWTTGTDLPASANDGDIHLKFNGEVYQYSAGQWVLNTSIKGPQGVQGPRGPQGVVGPQGPQGTVGPQGPTGDQFDIKGPVANITQLPDPTTQSRNTAYLVGSSAPYDLYIITDDGDELQWALVGSFASLDNIQTIILDVPEDATSGTLTNSQIDIIQNSDAVIKLGKDIYHITENNTTDGYITFSSFNNTYINTITITIADGSWVKTSYNNDFIPDSYLSLTSANPVENRVVTAQFENVDSEINNVDNKKLDKDGYSALAHVGLADNVASPDGVTDIAQYDFRPTAGTSSVTDGNADIKSIRGNTWIYNQLAYISTQQTVERNGVIFTNNGDGTWTLNGTATDNASLNILASVKATKNHKYTLNGNQKGNANAYIAVFYNSSFHYPDTGNGSIFTWDRDENVMLISLRVLSGTTVNNLIIRPQVVDLTKMFGAGKEPTTVAEFNNLTRGIIDWYYSEGEMLNAKIDGVKSVGFNAFDGEIEGGKYNNQTGVKTAQVNEFRSKNFIPVVSGKSYTVYSHNVDYTAGSVSIYEYDKDFNFLNHQYSYERPYAVFNISDRTAYITFSYYKNNSDWGDSNTPTDAQICIHLTHSGYRNGQYEPYWTETRTLPVNDYFPHGMKSAGNAYDELTSKRATTNIGAVDLGTLLWGSSGTDRFNSSVVMGMKTDYPGNIKPNIRCVRYETVSFNDQTNADQTITILYANGLIYIKDSNYTDAEAFKASLSGVILFYELENPIVTEIEQTREIDWFYRISDFGTEQQLISEGFQVPCSLETFYMNNLRDKIRNLPDIPKCEDTTGTSVLKCINGVYTWVREE